MVKQERPAVAPKGRPAAVAKPEPKKTPVDVLVLLMPSGDADFIIHEKGCKSYARDKGRSSYKGLQDYELTQVANQLEVIREVWSDQIAEQWDEDPKNADTDYGTAPWAWLVANGYVGSVKFHSCLDGLPQQAKAPAKGAGAKKAAKAELAGVLIESVAFMLDSLLEANMADSEDPYAAPLATITAGFKDDAEVRQCVAQWLHHIPADRERWAASGMAIPDRSDWVAYRARMNGAASEGDPAEDSTDPAEDPSDDTEPQPDADEPTDTEAATEDEELAEA